MRVGMTELCLLLTAAVANFAPTSRHREFTFVEKASVTKLICRSVPSQFQEVTAGRSLLLSFLLYLLPLVFISFITLCR